VGFGEAPAGAGFFVREEGEGFGDLMPQFGVGAAVDAVPFGLGAQGPGLAFGAELGAFADDAGFGGVAGGGEEVVGAVGGAEVGEGPQAGGGDADGGGVAGEQQGVEGGVYVVEGGGGVALPEGVFGGQAAVHVGDERVVAEGAQPFQAAFHGGAAPAALDEQGERRQRGLRRGADAGAEAGGDLLGLVPVAGGVVDEEAEEAQLGAVGAPVEAGLVGEADAGVGDDGGIGHDALVVVDAGVVEVGAQVHGEVAAVAAGGGEPDQVVGLGQAVVDLGVE